MQTHRKPKSYECEKCQRTFKFELYFKHHKCDIERQNCEFCGKNYKNRLMLTYHIKNMQIKSLNTKINF